MKPGAVMPTAVVVVWSEVGDVVPTVVPVVEAVVEGSWFVVGVVEGAAVPHEASRNAPASTSAVLLPITPVYAGSPFAFTGGTDADEREVRSFDFCESVGDREVFEASGNLIERYVDRLSAVLTHEVLVVALPREMYDCRPMPQMDVMEYVESFEDVEGAVHGRLVDSDSRGLLRSRSQFGRVEVLPDAAGECFADCPPRRGDAQPLRSEICDERVCVDHGALNDGTPVIALPSISVWISLVPSYV